jgi:hypothetical protein
MTEGVSDTTVALPFFSRLSEEDVARVAAVVQHALYATRRTVAHPVHRPVLQ